MALFSFRSKTAFRVRSPERDRETDVARGARLQGLLDELRQEIERERDGLRDRYEDVSTRAAFSQQVLEDGQADAISPAIDDLTDAMIRYSARLKKLDEQIDFVTGLRGQADAFPL